MGVDWSKQIANHALSSSSREVFNIHLVIFRLHVSFGHRALRSVGRNKPFPYATIVFFFL